MLRTPLLTIVAIGLIPLLLVPSLAKNLLTNTAHVSLIHDLIASPPNKLVVTSPTIGRFETLNKRYPSEQARARLALSNFAATNYSQAATHFDSTQTQNIGSPLDSTSSIHHALRAIVAFDKQQAQAAVTNFRFAYYLSPTLFDRGLFLRYYQAVEQVEPHSKKIGQITTWLATNGQPPVELYSNLTQYNPIQTPITEAACWQLVQLAYDHMLLDTGPLIPILLTWQHKTSNNTHEQQVIVHNLVPNGGFTWGMLAGEPLGYPNTIYDEDNPSITHHIVEASRGQNGSTVVELRNTEAHYNSSFATNAIDIDSSKQYFLGAVAQGKAATGSIGYAWRDEVGRRLHNFPITGINSAEWQQFGSIFTPAATIHELYIWLLNFQSTGSVFFDDILFFAIDPPDCNE